MRLKFRHLDSEHQNLTQSISVSFQGVSIHLLLVHYNTNGFIYHGYLYYEYTTCERCTPSLSSCMTNKLLMWYLQLNSVAAAAEWGTAVQRTHTTGLQGTRGLEVEKDDCNVQVCIHLLECVAVVEKVLVTFLFSKRKKKTTKMQIKSKPNRAHAIM